MSNDLKRERLLEETRASRRNRKAADLRRLMSAWGFKAVRTRHGMKHVHSDFGDIYAMVCEHKEKGQGSNIFACYVDNCMDAIERLKERLEDEKE